MRKIFVLIMAIVVMAGCTTTDPRIDKLESKIAKLERQMIMGQATGAGANIYPVTGALTGGGTGALDKITTTSDKDSAVVMFNNEATWGDAFFPYTLDVDGGGTESVPYLIKSGDGGNEDWRWIDVYGRNLYGQIPFLSVADSCVIGSDCDGTKVRLAWGGVIQNTVTAKVITLPEIVASAPTSIQVVPGASICIMNRDANETTTVQTHANDKITLLGVQSSADRYIISTGSATSVNIFCCVIADAADNWTVMGYSGTWTAE
jgi:hypothetical protein